jgi:hypothetical protein
VQARRPFLKPVAVLHAHWSSLSLGSVGSVG